MQYEFKTVHELTEIMESAVKHATKTPHSDTADPEMVSEFVQKTITTLRIFVNDELNQLDYAIRYLAAKYLKNTGILAVIAHNEVEKKVVHRCLKQNPKQNEPVWLQSATQAKWMICHKQLNKTYGIGPAMG